MLQQNERVVQCQLSTSRMAAGTVAGSGFNGSAGAPQRANISEPIAYPKENGRFLFPTFLQLVDGGTCNDLDGGTCNDLDAKTFVLFLERNGKTRRLNGHVLSSHPGAPPRMSMS